MFVLIVAVVHIDIVVVDAASLDVRGDIVLVVAVLVIVVDVNFVCCC